MEGLLSDRPLRNHECDSHDDAALRTRRRGRPIRLVMRSYFFADQPSSRDGFESLVVVRQRGQTDRQSDACLLLCIAEAIKPPSGFKASLARGPFLDNAAGGLHCTPRRRLRFGDLMRRRRRRPSRDDEDKWSLGGNRRMDDGGGGGIHAGMRVEYS